MKAPIISLFSLLLFVGCSSDSKLTFEPLSIAEKACDGCPEISIEIPKALDQTNIAKTINTALEEELISVLIYDEEIEAATITEAIRSFKNGYEELKSRYPDETAGWEAKINGEVTYEDKNMLTIELKSYLFTGGAHGYSSSTFLNFDKRKGDELENWELFEDQERIKHFAETKFRIQEGVPQDDPINSTGFMFENAEFYLPENIGFTEKGLVLLYNQYEVASFADGAIEVLIPFNEVKNYLSKKVQPNVKG